MTYQEACAELEISAEATIEEIKKSYRSLISFYHPDNFQDNETKRKYAEEKTKRLNASWAYIEQNYDAYRSEASRQAQTRPNYEQSTDGTVENDIFSDPGFNKKEYLKVFNQREKLELRALKALKSRKKYSNPEVITVLKTCAYGILLRQASEYIVRSLVISHGGEDLVSGGNQDFIRNGIAFLMDNQIIDSETYRTLEELRRLTNNIVHIHRPIEGDALFVECQRIYTQHFRTFIQNIVQWNHVNLYYLLVLKDELDKFDGNDFYKFIFNGEHQMTRTLAKGVLMRRCMEYAVDKKVILETKNIAIQNRLGLKLREKIDTVFSGSYQSALHRVREATNAVLHVDVRYYNVNQNGYEVQQESRLSSCYSDLLGVSRNRYIPAGVKALIAVLLIVYVGPVLLGFCSEVAPEIETFIEELDYTEEDKAWKELYRFEKVNGGYAVYPRSKSISGVVEIPATFAGEPVVEIGAEAFKKCEGITELIMSNNIVTIKESAFEGCTALTKVNFSEALTIIEKSAFEGCLALTSVILPDAITTLPSSAFYGCEALIEVKLPAELKKIGSRTFANCGSIEILQLPNGIEAIGSWAFENCRQLVQINIPVSLTELKSWTFQGCSSLRSIYIPANVKEVGIEAFRNCSGLQEITIEDGVGTTSIDPIFTKCIGVQKATIPATWVSHISNIPIYEIIVTGTATKKIGFVSNDDVLSIKLEHGIEVIEDYDFYYLKNLKEIYFPSSVIKIEKLAFSNCPSLTDIYYDGTMEQWGRIENEYKKRLVIHCHDGVIEININ